MRQTLSIVLIVIAAILVVGVKVVAPKPGSPRTFHRGQDSGAQQHEEFSERAPARMTSAIGTKRTSLVALHMSAFGCKANMTYCGANVCF